MKHRIFIMALLAIIVASCNTEEPEQPASPQADFSFTAEELTVSFQNKSVNAYSQEWDFGDGRTSTEKAPIITYAKEGTYLVRLKVSNKYKYNVCEKKITVSYKTPNANFTFKVEQPLKVVLTNTSSNATSYKWEFGDGQTSTVKNPTHRFDGIGVYRVKLTVKNATHTDVCEKNVTIEAPTICYFTGFKYNKIPYNNYYYQLQLTDDYTLSKTTYAWSSWHLISSANISEPYTFTNPVKIDISKKYVARVYASSSKKTGQASGKGDYYTTITSATLNKYPETITWSGTNIGMEFYFQWK